MSPGKCLICLSRGRWSSPSIAPMAAAVRGVALRPRQLSPTGLARRCNTASGSAPWCFTCCTTSCLPEQRLATLMADLFSVHLVTATIVRISQDCAERFLGFIETVRNRVAAAPVKHLDETGFRIGGKTQWLHVASTMLLTFYRVAAKRGSLPENMTGIVVHDHWKPYYTLIDVRHALCNAHHLRELQALVEIEKEDWALRMQHLLRRACQAVNLAREQDAPLKPGLMALIERG